MFSNMHQTAWIIGGGIAIVLVAIGLYIMSGGTSSSSYITKGPSNTEKTPSASLPAHDITMSETASEAIIRTSMGDITIKLYPKEAPNTVANFVKLAKEGFYDGIKFHRVIKGFMNQVGDPLTKDDTKKNLWGTGGPGYQFEDEINRASPLYQKGYKTGVVAMANAGPNTNGSQFFIMAADVPLDPNYTIFGEVTSGFDVVAAINGVKTDERDRPIEPVTILSVSLPQ